jgi:hypothetical protein
MIRSDFPQKSLIPPADAPLKSCIFCDCAVLANRYRDESECFDEKWIHVVAAISFEACLLLKYGVVVLVALGEHVDSCGSRV